MLLMNIQLTICTERSLSAKKKVLKQDLIRCVFFMKIQKDLFKPKEVFKEGSNQVFFLQVAGVAKDLPFPSWSQ